tara:strand:+ start:550 stop:741 length:192 start_codon:yes stop_codon:yes gene_type:complete
MDGQSIVKIIVTAVIGLTIVSFATTTQDVTANKVRIDKVESSVDKMSKQMDDVHWHLIRKDRD